MTTVITSFSQPVLRGQSRPRTGFASTVLRALFLSIAMLAATSIAPRLARASDHGDTPLLKSIPRHDARMTDLYAFVRKDCSAFFCRKHLVLVATLDPTIPPDATTYRFAEDLTVRIAIDNAAEIAFDNPDDVRNFGGTIIQPDEVHHHVWARDFLVQHCTTAELQERAAAATRSSLAVADELRSLMTKTTGLAAIPMS